MRFAAACYRHAQDGAVSDSERDACAPRQRITVELDAGLWAWLSEVGEPHQALVRVLARAWRANTLARAWAAERAIEVLIRQRQRQLRQRLSASAAAVSSLKLRSVAEEHVLRACEEHVDPAVQAAAERVRLRLMISRREVEDERLAKAELRRLRHEHPAEVGPAGRARRASQSATEEDG